MLRKLRARRANLINPHHFAICTVPVWAFQGGWNVKCTRDMSLESADPHESDVLLEKIESWENL